jgi:hypothetical protein
MVEQHLPSRAGQYSWVDRVTLAVCSGSKSDTARKTFSYQCRERPLCARSGHSTTDKLSTHFLSATTCRLRMNGCFAPILLQKSIFRQSNAAKCRSANTKVRGRFSAKRYGPSRREAHQRL